MFLTTEAVIVEEKEEKQPRKQVRLEDLKNFKSSDFFK